MNMRAVVGHEVELVRGEGVFVYDDRGTRYLDASSGLWFCAVGHGRREIAAAIGEQLSTLAAYSAFDDYTNAPACALAERIRELAPMSNASVLLSCGGSDAIETAAKLALRYWSEVGEGDRTHFIGRRDSYHGMGGFGTSIGGIAANKEGIGDPYAHTAHVPFDDAAALEARIEEIGADRVAAFFVEPVLGAGGMVPPPAGYLKAVAEICRRHGVLLVVDEVITAWGRLGHWFACERFEITPDIVTCAKGLTSGYWPLGATIAGERVTAPFWNDRGSMFRHGYTLSASPAGARAALANIDVLEREGLVDRVRELEPLLAELVEPLRGLSGVRDVRHIGLLAAVELEPDILAIPGIREELPRRLRARGILTRLVGGTSVLVAPPLVISDQELEAITAAVTGTLLELAS